MLRLDEILQKNTKPEVARINFDVTLEQQAKVKRLCNYYNATASEIMRSIIDEIEEPEYEEVMQ